MSENNRRAKFYSITRNGSKQPASETEDCERTSGIIGSLVAFAGQARQSISPAEAGSTARSPFGHTVLLKQMRREMSFSTVEALRQDVRFGLRMLRRSPGFAAVAVLTLAVGIGANAAIFSVVKAVLLDPLPYAHADRLVIIGEPLADDPNNPLVPYTVMREIAARSQCLERVSAYGDGPAMLMENDRPEMLRGLSVDSNFFDTMGAHVALGRNFLPSEQQPNQRLAIILSHSLWVRRFGGDPHILGRQLRVSRGPVTVVGILPPAFLPLLKATSTSVPEMYYPQPVDPFATCHDCQRLRFLGRLKRDVTLEQASMELNGIFADMMRESPESYPLGARISLVALPDSLLGRARTALWAVWCAAGFVLLIACANVANLLMARAAGRTHEIALRTALGAGRGRLIRQLLTESMVLATAGGVLGTALALLGTGALASLAPDGIPRAQSAHVDTTVLGIACAATVLAGLLFGMLPALSASQVNLTCAIKGAGEGGLTHNGLRQRVHGCRNRARVRAGGGCRIDGSHLLAPDDRRRGLRSQQCADLDHQRKWPALRREPHWLLPGGARTPSRLSRHCWRRDDQPDPDGLHRAAPPHHRRAPSTGSNVTHPGLTSSPCLPITSRSCGSRSSAAACFPSRTLPPHRASR